MERREFLRTAVGGLAASAAAQQPAPANKKKTIGIQVGAVSFVDEGVDRLLDLLQEKAGINTIFLAVWDYSHGIGGRQMPGHPLPDHGKQEYGDFHGGNFCTVHPQYYKDTGVRPEDTRAPDHPGVDILEAVLPAAKKRGIRIYTWADDEWRRDIPNIDRLQQVDLHGRRTERACYNNPYYRNFLLGLTEDYIRSYDVDGVAWCMEASGALESAITDDSINCFCQYCQQKARRQGIVNFDRVRKGFQVLEELQRACRAGKRPVDGYYVTFWRTLLRYPELLAWEHFWHEGLRDAYREIYAKVKSVNPNLPCGWHIEHSNTFSYTFRAERELKEMEPYTDFLKMVMYHNCAGERMADYVSNLRPGAYGDFTNEGLLMEYQYKVMNFRERSFGEIPYTGFSSDYVYREAKRAMDGAAGTKMLIWPGIDIDIPTAANHSRCTPGGTRDAVLAAFRAEVDGVILSRKYSEMMLGNLAGAGEAIRKLGYA